MEKIGNGCGGATPRSIQRRSAIYDAMSGEIGPNDPVRPPGAVITRTARDPPQIGQNLKFPSSAASASNL